MKAYHRRSNLQTALIIEEPAVTIPGKLDRVFRAHHSMVFRTAYRITGNAADAEDVLQTVFLRLLRQGDDVPDFSNEEGYFRRAAINAALDVVRSRQPERSLELSEAEAVGGHAVSRELRGALARALAQLKPRSAEIFTLRYFDGFTNLQIARMLGISQVLVAVSVHRTRQQLRKELGTYLGDRP
ncbi:MAG TPA: sigma-70 family RNA polymerase sigma factor [Candidatus Sulfotelmatobacter sp.]|nr:sigma-70 family RNA polymerase sigma factor [Candidatus Sulfotelmatobacter sp.]